MAEEELDISKEPSEVPLIDVSEVNPEGYGIEGDFVPVAVFEEHHGKVEIDSYGGTDEDFSVSYGGEYEEEEYEERLGESIGEEGGEGGLEEAHDYVPGYLEQEEEEEVQEVEAEEEEEEEEEKSKEDEETKKVKLIGVLEPKTTDKGIYRKRLSIRDTIIRDDQFEDKRRVSGDGDFRMGEDVYGFFGSPPSIETLHSTSTTSTYAESIPEIVVEEELPPIDREEYYQVYRDLEPLYSSQKLKNNFLQKKMADYFKKKKMEHVLKETDNQVDSQAKYDRKLEVFANYKESDNRERSNISWELEDLTSQRDEQLEVLTRHFQAMQQTEKETGTGLINTKTGKEIPEKLVDRFVKRQRDKSIEIATMRLMYIKLRNRIAEKKLTLKRMNYLGKDMNLMDFEQLKIENQSHTDKIEERDFDLAKLRTTCRTEIQCLAHVREKSAAVHDDVSKLKKVYDEVDMECLDARERVNYLKQQRVNYRFQIEKLKTEAGLLCTPKLCLDRDKTLEELNVLAAKHDQLKQENIDIRDGIRALKKNISRSALDHTPKKNAHQLLRKSKTERIYKGRPTLIYPELPESEWGDSLKQY